MLKSDEDENSPNVPLATITCIRKIRKEEESRVSNEVVGLKEEV
jgi:hypothetical protein